MIWYSIPNNLPSQVKKNNTVFNRLVSLYNYIQYYMYLLGYVDTSKPYNLQRKSV